MNHVPKNEKVLLVYSGGLDTSICIPLMREEYGYKHVVTVTIDVGQDPADIKQAAEKAKFLQTEHYTVDAKEEFVEKFCWPAVRANGDYQGYPMSTSIARPLIAAKAVEYAKKLGITSFAHGCTGKGNDQYRIEFGIRSLMPQATIHAPVRERNMTRSWEIEYALKKNIPIQQSLSKIWSIDENLWGRSIEGGRLEEPNYPPPEEIFQWTKSTGAADSHPEEISVQFLDGVPVAINNEKSSPQKLVTKLNSIAGKHGIGRIDIMEDRMMGLKVRENYECPGATVLLKAHKALENLVLTRDEIRVKTLIDQEWSRLAYEGLWWDPLKENLEAFIGSTQKRVDGGVTLKLYKGQATVIGRHSEWALYSGDLASFDTTTFDQRESTGSVKNFGLQSRLYNQLVQKHQKEI
ncbi:MAG: argininosuccinate synthase [Pseudomonadota bacterium]|nr:argininosuccinate synthase [Pseudomonadota bacterium]